MDAMLVLTFIIHSDGAEAFAYSFSAKSISESQHRTIYNARKNLKELREWGLIQRNGNLYMFTMDGWNIANDLIKSSQKYTMFNKSKGE